MAKVVGINVKTIEKRISQAGNIVWRVEGKFTETPKMPCTAYIHQHQRDTIKFEWQMLDSLPFKKLPAHGILGVAIDGEWLNVMVQIVPLWVEGANERAQTDYVTDADGQMVREADIPMARAIDMLKARAKLNDKLSALIADVEAEIARNYPQLAELHGLLKYGLAEQTGIEEQVKALALASPASAGVSPAISLVTTKRPVWDEQGAVDWAVEHGLWDLIDMKPRKNDMKKRGDLPAEVYSEEDRTEVRINKSVLRD